MMKPAPVVLFVYNRAQHSLRTLEALSANELAGDSTLIIYADGPKPDATEEDLKKIRLTREVIRSKQWLGAVEIREAEANRGLARSVIHGVTETVDKWGKVIVLEDDLITAKGFLKYMNTALEKYEGEERVMQISGYQFPIRAKSLANSSFFLPFTTSWGWATWKRSWNCFDANATGYRELKTDKDLSYRFNLHGSYPYADMLIRQMESIGIDSWAIRWWWSVFRRNGFVLYPGKSLVYNHGYGEGATHTSESGNALNTTGFDKLSTIENFPGRISVDDRRFLAVKKILSVNSGAKSANFFKKFFSTVIGLIRTLLG